jgi:hypothetical protein
MHRSYLDRMGSAAAGTKRLSRLLHSAKWTARQIERFLWWYADQYVQAWKQQGWEGLVLWDGSVWEKECKLLRKVAKQWGRVVLHVFDRGYASSVWLGAWYGFAVRFVLRWRHDYPLVDAQGQKRLAWNILQGKRAWGKGRPLWDAKRRTIMQASVLACPVHHPDFPEWQLWLVVARRQGGSPWYLLTTATVETEEQAWAVVLAYAFLLHLLSPGFGP